MNKETVHSVPEEKKHVQKHDTIKFSYKRKNQRRRPDEPQKKKGGKKERERTETLRPKMQLRFKERKKVTINSNAKPGS